MDRAHEDYQSYSWHQVSIEHNRGVQRANVRLPLATVARPGESRHLTGILVTTLTRHRVKATVLLLVPYDTVEDDVSVSFAPISEGNVAC